MALLVVLEQLTPAERTVFLLHDVFDDVFDLDFDRIADALGVSPASAWQSASRARRRIAAHGAARFSVDPAAARRLSERFAAAASDGDLDGLVAVLAADATGHFDTGGVFPGAPTEVIVGAETIACNFLARVGGPSLDFKVAEVNAGPSAPMVSSTPLARDGRVRTDGNIRRRTLRAHEARRVRHRRHEQRDEPIVGVADARPRDSVDGAGDDVPALPDAHSGAACRTDLLDEPGGPCVGGGDGAEGGLRQLPPLRGERAAVYLEDGDRDVPCDGQRSLALLRDDGQCSVGGPHGEQDVEQRVVTRQADDRRDERCEPRSSGVTRQVVHHPGEMREGAVRACWVVAPAFARKVRREFHEARPASGRAVPARGQDRHDIRVHRVAHGSLPRSSHSAPIAARIQVRTAARIPGG
ncbi:sigma factor-like helix-turn-helix DNA-binding protein [Agromyces bauzanensis]|uniref:RNA polymerase sigma factor 70 region 4 type 2 domain-containing protein n=1 Tax=Agromyces bauzanensis TaxID=1308924 RepID=A0A917PRG2_9MICO|nr:sigma factor-like helix-turn-helix DNA-binding protein [Agromyces bauzanensis]GGJ88969.1 hypothetical protein GCM10011372_29440 [Agromyces bauzanensis]